MEVLVDSPRRVRSIVAEPRGAHACVLFDDDGCELHCLLAKVPPNSLRSITAAVFVPPPPPAFPVSLNTSNGVASDIVISPLEIVPAKTALPVVFAILSF